MSLPAKTLTPTSSPAPVLQPVARYDIDTEHTTVGFRVRHMMVTWTQGRFRDVKGTLSWNPVDPEKSEVEVLIDAASVDTNQPKRDDHLRSEDFFFAEKFPHLTFRSQRVERRGENRYAVAGLLTIRGVSKEVVLDVVDGGQDIKDPWGGIRRGFTATTRVNRKDYGLMWNAALELGGVAVGDDVEIHLEVELLKQA
jgi:polyisoprenoid-binding protein YceI